MPRPYALAPSITALIVFLLCVAASGLCFYARSDMAGAALALIALLFGADTVWEWRRAAAEARAQERLAPFVRPNTPPTDTH